MNRNVVLLVDADANTVSAVSSIAALADFDVRFAHTSSDSFPLTREDLTDVELIVLDADSDLQSLNVLEALAEWVPNPPVIMISGPDQKVFRPVMFAHVVTEFLEKPVSIESLKKAMARFMHTQESHHCRCDVWGHPCTDCKQRRGAPHDLEIDSFAEKT